MGGLARAEPPRGGRTKRCRTVGLPSVFLISSATAVASSRGLSPRLLAVSMARNNFSRSNAQTSNASSVTSPVGGSEYMLSPAACAASACASASARADGAPARDTTALTFIWHQLERAGRGAARAADEGLRLCGRGRSARFPSR